jgi:GT2 family glycosyltransferase
MNLIPVIIPFFKDHEALVKNKLALELQEKTSIELFIKDNSDDNILFTKAINIGLRKFCYDFKYKYTLILNQDAFLDKNCINELVITMEENPKCGISTPISLDNKGNVNWCGGLDAFPWGVHKLIPIEKINSKTLPSFWANGACMLLRNEMVREIGLLDENMRFICSDSDYSFTARSRGWEVVVATAAKMEHSLSGSGGKANNWLSKIKFEDQLYFAEKWLSGDLFKRISYEGNRLTKMRIVDELRKTKNQINLINQIEDSSSKRNALV